MNVSRKSGDLRARLRGSAGVTAVEYALILGLVVVGVFGALSGFDEHAKDELTARGNRVGNPEQLRATDTLAPGPTLPTTTTSIITSSTTSPVSTTSTTTTTIVLPTTTSASTTTVATGSTTTSTTTTTTSIVSTTPHAFVGALVGTSVDVDATYWTATVFITVVDQHGTPLEGVLVHGGWSESAAHVADCVTGTGGTCSVSQTDLERSGATAAPSTTYHVLALSGDGIIPVGPDLTTDFIEVLQP